MRVALEPCKLAALTVRELDAESEGSLLSALLFFEQGPVDSACPLHFLARFSDSSASSTCMSGTAVELGRKVVVHGFGCKGMAAKWGRG